MEISVKKGIELYVPGTVDSALELTKEPGIDRMLDHYQMLLDNYRDGGNPSPRYQQRFVLEPNYKYLRKNAPDVLTPEQINSLVQVIKVGYGDDWKATNATGIFLSKMIQNSYYGGFNNFELETGPMYLTCLGFHNQGREDNLLKVTINGNTGTLGPGAEYCHFTVKGHCLSWGYTPKDCIFEFETLGQTNKPNGCTFRTSNPRTIAKFKREGIEVEGWQ